jgi:hypothetical protein
MFEIFSNGTHYLISLIGAARPGWLAIGAAATLEEGYIVCNKDWDHFWDLCDLVPSRPISITFA